MGLTKMARFLLALLLAAVLAPRSNATRGDKNQLGEVEQSQSQLHLPENELQQVATEQIVQRVLRSNNAAREGKRSNGKGVKEKKGKDKSAGKKEKKGKKGRRGQKTQQKRKNQQRRKQRKNGKKSKKAKTNKQRNGKGRKQQKRKQMRKEKNLRSRSGRKNAGKCGRSGRAINETCITDILAMYAVYANQMKNFEKQFKRIRAKNKTANNKGGKKGAFNKALERLVEQGGGNKSNLTCQGSSSNDGAKQLKNLTEFLTNCSTMIKDACNITVPGNMSEMMQCETDVKAFGGEFDKCKKLSGEAACSCFGNDTLQDMGNKTKKCNLANESKAMVEADKKCKQAYGECRKYQEDIIGAVSSCSKSTDKLKEKAKALTENSKNLDNAKKAVSALTTRRRQTAHQRGRRAAPTDCAGMITLATLVITVISENPASPQVSVYCLEIVAATGITCTDAEKTSLKGVETSMEEAAEKVKEAKEAVFEDLENQTGTTPSSTELESFKPEGEVTTAAPKTRRRFEDFLKGVLK